MSNLDTTAAYESMFRIRRFEETILDKFQTGVFHGTTHTYIGQEANAVGILDLIRERGDVGVELEPPRPRDHGPPEAHALRRLLPARPETLGAGRGSRPPQLRASMP